MTSGCCLLLAQSFGPSPPPAPTLVALYLPLNITGLALHIFSKLSGTDTGSPEATTGKATEAGPAKPTWGMQDIPALSRDTPRVLGRHGDEASLSSRPDDRPANKSAIS